MALSASVNYFLSQISSKTKEEENEVNLTSNFEDTLKEINKRVQQKRAFVETQHNIDKHHTELSKILARDSALQRVAAEHLKGNDRKKQNAVRKALIKTAIDVNAQEKVDGYLSTNVTQREISSITQHTLTKSDQMSLSFDDVIEAVNSRVSADTSKINEAKVNKTQDYSTPKP